MALVFIAFLFCFLLHLTASASTPCTAGSQPGTCMSVDACFDILVPGLCPGSDDNQCCVHFRPTCVANGQHGECLHFETCRGLGGSHVYGHCPGSYSFQCCIGHSYSISMELWKAFCVVVVWVCPSWTGQLGAWRQQWWLQLTSYKLVFSIQAPLWLFRSCNLG